MRKSVWIICAIGLLLCLSLLLLKKQATPTSRSGEPPLATNRLIQQQATQPQPVKPTSVALGANDQKATNMTSLSVAPITNAINPQLLANWQGSIQFYGKIEDENSNPIASADVHFQWNEKPTPDGVEAAETQSDTQGTFSLHGARGLVLTVSVDKDGYYSSHRDRSSFTYGSLGGPRFFPDAQNPVIFHLKKKGEGQQLIVSKYPAGIGQIVQLHHDGTPINLDLLQGNRVSSGQGQLQLQLTRDVSDKSAKTFDWQIQLSVPGGGIIQTDEEFPYEAPATGYQPSVVYDMPATNQFWQDNIRSKYYILLPDGKFGRIDFYLFAYNGVFTVQSAVNPSGSRDLEPAQ